VRPSGTAPVQSAYAVHSRPRVLPGRPRAAAHEHVAHAGRQPTPQPARWLTHVRRSPSCDARGTAAALDRADGGLRHAGVTPARGRRGGDAAQGKRSSPAMPRRWRCGWGRQRCQRRGMDGARAHVARR
jgi:hypothetical protein